MVQVMRVRWWSLLLAILAGVSIVFFVSPAEPARAECGWQTPWDCLPGRNDPNGTSQFECKEAPPAARPDSGLAGWFARAPKNPSAADPFKENAVVSPYDVYGYAGFDFATYDLGCGPDAVREPGAVTTTTIANLLYAPALWLTALDNSVREYAYQPDSMWGWTDSLVKQASDALRDRVFTPWGGFVLALVGIWLLWGARGGNMSAAVVTAGWAILVMAFVSAVAAWPLQASTAADSTLTGALGQVNGLLAGDNPNDKRDPAVRASGVLTKTVLYNQWVRGTLGSADSDVAKKYGPDLYRARAISWAEAKQMSEDSAKRDAIFKEKAALWNNTAEKIKSEDPEAYEYLVGRKGTERIGAAILALVSALVVTPFDIMASLLILIAFLIIRLAVIFLPVIGTVGILMPAAGPLRGMLRTVAAALINCVIFGAGSAVFLLGTEVITGTRALAGWQQILLIWLVGLILWLLLRPYRRLTQLTGVDPFNSIAGSLGRMQQRVLGTAKQLAVEGAGNYAALEAHDRKKERRAGIDTRSLRPETWSRQKMVSGVMAAAAHTNETAQAAKQSADVASKQDNRTQSLTPLAGQMRSRELDGSSEYKVSGSSVRTDSGRSVVPIPRVADTSVAQESDVDILPIYRPEADRRAAAHDSTHVGQ